MAAEREDAGRFIVHADQELPAFVELESAIQTDGHNHECDCPNWMKNCEIIADNLSKGGCSRVTSQPIDPSGRTIWIADAYRDNGKRFIVRADES